MDSTNIYAYISIIALLFCLPPAIIVSCFNQLLHLFLPLPTFLILKRSYQFLTFQIEGPQLMQYGFKEAIAKVGLYKFLSDLFWIGMFYHLYNQVNLITLIYSIIYQGIPLISLILSGCNKHFGKSRTSYPRRWKRAEARLCDRVLHCRLR